MIRLIYKKIILAICVLIIINTSICLAVNMSDNDGSAFITKAEFDSLKNNFQSQIDSFNSGIDSKIDTAIASYLAGIKVSREKDLSLPTSQKIFKTFDSTNFPWVDGKHDMYRLSAGLAWFANGREAGYPAQYDHYLVTYQEPDKNAKAVFIDKKNIGGADKPIYMGYATNWNFVAKTIGEIDSTSANANTAITSNLNRYKVIRGVNCAIYQNGRSGPGSIKTTETFTDKTDHIIKFSSYNPIMYTTSEVDVESFREGVMYLMPSYSASWDITAYDVSEKLVSVYSKFVPDFCYSYTKKPNNLKYVFFDVNNSNSTTKTTEINKAFAEISKWHIESRVLGWWYNVDATTGAFAGTTDITDRQAIMSDDKKYITPTWTSAEADSWFYGIYWPKPWSDNEYLPNTEKLYTDEYSKIANEEKFKNIVGTANVFQSTTTDGTTNYYNLSAGLVLNYDDSKGKMTVKFKNTGSKAIKLYIMKKPLNVTTGYVKDNIIVTDKSNTASKNEIDIPAGNTVEVSFEKKQDLILFSFHGVNGGSTAPATLEVQEMKVLMEE